MRITAVLSPTSLCYLSASGAVWSVLVVLCAAKHFENNPTGLDSDPPVSQNNSEDCKHILCIYMGEAQLRGQDDIPSRDGSPKQGFEFEQNGQIARAKSQNENEEEGKHSADEPVVNDVQVFKAVDYEEERKIASDMTNWNNGHLPRQMHGLSLCRAQNLSLCRAQSGNSPQPCEGKQYLECQCGALYYQIREAKARLDDLQEAYARYAGHTTWNVAAHQVSFNENALPLPMQHLTPATKESCGPFPVLETNRENKANISERSYEYNTENFVYLMSSTYEIVTVLTWLLDTVRLDLAMGPDTNGTKSKVLDNLLVNNSDDSSTLSARLSQIRRITLSEIECRNRKPNNNVLVEILQSKLEDIGGPDHIVRGLQVILLLGKCVSILSQL